jgi:hypothetical protein
VVPTEIEVAAGAYRMLLRVVELTVSGVPGGELLAPPKAEE